jgi:DNA-binding response OmpR family regulator
MKRPQHERKRTTETILCVDDDLSLLDLYQLELSEEGYRVIVAKDGKEALRKFVEESPDLVVMDICMPAKDGIETLAAMLGGKRHMPVILNTAFPQYRENFMTWGAEAYLLKSSDLTELKQKIREILEKGKKR